MIVFTLLHGAHLSQNFDLENFFPKEKSPTRSIAARAFHLRQHNYGTVKVNPAEEVMELVTESVPTSESV